MAWEPRTGAVAISRTERLESGSLEEGSAIQEESTAVQRPRGREGPERREWNVGGQMEATHVGKRSRRAPAPRGSLAGILEKGECGPSSFQARAGSP